MRVLEVLVATLLMVALLAVAPTVDRETTGTVTFVNRGSPWAPELPPQSAEERARRMELHLVELVNAERADHGLAPVAWSEALAEDARHWSEHLVEAGRVVSADPADVVATLPAVAAVLDNVAAVEGLVQARELHLGWMDDEAGRRRILDPSADAIGVGVVCTPSGGAYVTQRLTVPAAPTRGAEPSGVDAVTLVDRAWIDRPGASCYPS